MSDLGRLAVSEPSLPPVVYVFMAMPEHGQRYLDAHTPDGAPPAVGIADPDQKLYEALGVPRGGWRQMFGARAWLAGARATLRGKTIGRKVGDGWTLPVWMVVDGDVVTWRWAGRHAGDRPDLDEVPRGPTPAPLGEA